MVKTLARDIWTWIRHGFESRFSDFWPKHRTNEKWPTLPQNIDRNRNDRPFSKEADWGRNNPPKRDRTRVAEIRTLKQKHALTFLLYLPNPPEFHDHRPDALVAEWLRSSPTRSGPDFDMGSSPASPIFDQNIERTRNDRSFRKEIDRGRNNPPKTVRTRVATILTERLSSSRFEEETTSKWKTTRKFHYFPSLTNSKNLHGNFKILQSQRRFWHLERPATGDCVFGAVLGMENLWILPSRKILKKNPQIFLIKKQWCHSSNYALWASILTSRGVRPLETALSDLFWDRKVRGLFFKKNPRVFLIKNYWLHSWKLQSERRYWRKERLFNEEIEKGKNTPPKRVRTRDPRDAKWT